MRRRTVLTMIAAGVAAEHLALAQRKLDKMLASPESYERLYFDLPQHQLLERLTELIIPADDHSPGAREARVADFIDLMTAHSHFSAQQTWESGLGSVEAAARAAHGKSFLACSDAEQDAVMRMMSSNEGSAGTELEKFFERLKSMTIDGYYTSSIGLHQDLAYEGNTAFPSYDGCTHPEHQA